MGEHNFWGFIDYFIFSTTVAPQLLASSFTQSKRAHVVSLSSHFYINHPFHICSPHGVSTLWFSLYSMSVSFLFFSLFLTISMFSDSENNSNPLYHEYFEDDDDNCHIFSDQILLIVNFSPASFVPDGQLSFQSDWSINWVGNAISEKFVPSLKVKYEILSSIELKKPQIGEFTSQPPSGAVAFHLDFFRYGFGCRCTPSWDICWYAWIVPRHIFPPTSGVP